MSTNTKSSEKDTIAFLVFALLLVVYVLDESKQILTPGNMWAPPVASHQASVTALWSLSDVYVKNSSEPAIAAQDNKLIVAGSTNILLQESVMALDERSGQLLWSMGYRSFSIFSIAIADSKVIVGSEGQVLALDIQNENTIWRTFVKTKVFKIVLQGQRLYVGTTKRLYYLLNVSNGEIIETLDQGKSYPEQDYPSFQGIQGNIISNEAITQSFVYALSKDGSLLRLSRETGQQETLIIFTGIPFVVNRDFHYYVIVDPATNILFVYLGDSAQLYAFQLPTS